MRALAHESPFIASIGGGHVFVGLLFCTVSLHYALSVPLAGWASRPTRLGSSAIMTMGLVRRSSRAPCRTLASRNIYLARTRFIPFLATSDCVPLAALRSAQLACAIAFILTGPSPMISALGPSPTIMLAACAMGVLGVGQGLSIVPNMEALLHATSSNAADAEGDPHEVHDSASVNIMAGLLNGAYSFGSMVAPISGSFMVERVGMPWACTIWSGVLVVAAIGTGVSWARPPSSYRSQQQPGRPPCL